MPVNHADLNTIGAVLVCPVAVGIVAVEERTGWFIPLFLLGGAAAGLAVGWLIQKVAYGILRVDTFAESLPWWRTWPMLIAYLVLPPGIAIVGIIGAGGVAVELARLAR